jgi:hypothetical protein
VDIDAFDRTVADQTTALLLRYFSSSGSVHLNRPVLAIDRDRELLRMHWALSPTVSDLAEYVLSHRHEIQSVLESTVRIEDGMVRGRLDAVATLRVRQRTGFATALVSHEPLRTFDSGPNHLLGWVLKEAWSLVTHFSKISLDSDSYRANVGNAVQRLERCHRLHAIAEISGDIGLRRRPTAHAITEAGRSRRMIYRKAQAAYKALLSIESGDPAVITDMLKQTLLAPLEPWRRFELAVGFCVAETLAVAQGKPLLLNLLVGNMRRHLAQAGRFSIFWQWRTNYFEAPAPEASEVIERAILAAYGMSASSDRPDLVVVDRDRDAVVAIVEVKYLTGEDASDRVRSAIQQIVRYARGYPAMGIQHVLGNSLAVVSQGIEGLTAPEPLPAGVPALSDYRGITQGALLPWSTRLLAAAPNT